MSSLAEVTLCTINMCTYVSDVGACIRYYVMPVSSCRCVSLAVLSGTANEMKITTYSGSPNAHTAQEWWNIRCKINKTSNVHLM